MIALASLQSQLFTNDETASLNYFETYRELVLRYYVIITNNA